MNSGILPSQDADKHSSALQLVTGVAANGAKVKKGIARATSQHLY